ncbi:hypothetical protein QLS31_08140 [Flavobacterium sp. XS2P24]|uniref:hypothetical protein n=1 Tax=Flavobacterium sp. XS2P24 TaxID=3041249 RepID=UPI0024A8384E|nr:hypothetical protein [Flavobacterium sp. XS2P24]MDI6049798.1 hypothetical protein [Flavobacterium sp. XS2P24]
MRKNYFSKKVLQSCVLFFMIITTNVFAQVGIGTITPHASSVLDVSSTTQGMLTPRMTTAQRAAIASPADGLMVYDTDLKSFYHYNSTLTSWNVMNSGTTGRLKFKRIKSTDVLATVLATEKAAGGNTKYVLDVNTYYEINGTIIFDLPIDLNNAYISGQDANEDKLVRTSGNLFDGATGGSIRNVTIQVTGGGKVFNLSGTAAQNIIIRDTIIAGSSSVGSITGFGLVFVSIVQYVGNITGIVYDSIGKLLISNAAWFSNNGGTYEKLQGTFGLVQKQGGFSEVSGAAVGFDVSSNPTITGDAVMETVVFTGTVTTGKYVNGYSPAIYSGYNFDNNWNVRCAGIPTEIDASAVGEFSVDYAVGSGASTGFSGSNPTSIIKVAGVSASSNLFRFSTGGVSNKLIYLGKKKRFFQVTGSISFQVPAIGTYIIYISKNGTPISQYKIYGRGAAVNDILVLPLNALVELSNSDYIEVFAQRYSSTNNNDSIITPNMALVVK